MIEITGLDTVIRHAMKTGRACAKSQYWSIDIRCWHRNGTKRAIFLTKIYTPDYSRMTYSLLTFATPEKEHQLTLYKRRKKH